MNQSTQTGLTQPIDKCVELYNSLFLKIFDQKKTLTRWIDNVFERVVILEKDVKSNKETLLTSFKLLNRFTTEQIKNNRQKDKMIDELQDEVEHLQNQISEMKEDIMNELREELLREMREEMRA